MARSNRRNRRGSKDAADGQGARRERVSQLPPEPQELDPETGLPAFLLEAIRTQHGAEQAARIVAGWDVTRRTTLRANALKASPEKVEAVLAGAGIAFERVPWFRDAFVLEPGAEERQLWSLDAYRDGEIYLQSLSSMLPPLALAPRPGADVLDMCAAPGGKTSEMAALASGRDGARAARITACELSVPRAEKLEHNLAKLGATNVQVMRTDARRLDSWFSFDQILVDAPCTGSGTVSTHDGHAARHLTPRLLERTTRSQAALFDKGLDVLKAGGELVYSTCSVLRQENEDVVRTALASHRDCELVEVELDGIDGLPTLPTELDGTLLVCPTELYEGFFVAKIRKSG